MATSDPNPSPALLRLRSADVVRLCGLSAAAAGLELLANHAVVAGARDGNRLMATVNDEPPRAAWVELAEEVDPARWQCACAHTGPFACAHIAAILAAWIAHPADFTAIGAGASSRAAPEGRRAPQPPQPGRMRVAPIPGETTLAEILASMSADDVAAIGRRILGAAAPGAAEDLRQRIVAALGDPARLLALLNRLDSPARALFALLELAGGAITSADLEGLANRIARPLSAVQGDIAVLERHALLAPMLPTSAPSEHGPGSSWRHVAGWRIPDDVRQAFSEPLPLEALPTQGDNRSAPPLTEPPSAPLRVLRGAPRMLCLALALLAPAPPPLGLLPAPAAEDSATPTRPGAGLLAPGELAPERLKDLARGAGVDAGAIRMARRLLLQAREQQTSPAIATLARVPVAERPILLRGAFQRWLRADSAADLLDTAATDERVKVRYTPTHPGFRPTAIAAAVGGARRSVTRLLGRARAETWYSLEAFIALAWQVNPGLLRGEQQTWVTPAWWLESAREQRMLQAQTRDDWMAAEGAFIRALVAGALFTWGVVDLAASAEGAVTAFRLTPFGAFLLRRAESAADAMDATDASLAALCDGDWGPPVLPLREGALAVQPLAADAQLLDALAVWATPTAVSGRRLVYTLSADRACAAFDRHLSSAALPSLLHPLQSRAAESVALRLNEWHARWGTTRIATGFTLLEASDEATLVEALAAMPEVGARCRRIGPTLALAPTSDAVTLRTLLARRGYTV